MVKRTAVLAACALWAAVPSAQAPAADLTNPAKFTERAPDVFDAKFETTKGVFIVHVTRDWAPLAADRFYNLVKSGFYDDNRFFRVVKDTFIQWGIHGDPAVTAAWNKVPLPAERARQSNTRGRVTFAMSGKNTATRTTQVFINMTNNTRLDQEGFGAFGQVTTSLIPLQSIFDGYGETLDQNRIQLEGNAILIKHAPELDYIKTARLLSGTSVEARHPASLIVN
jgi:peptidyl-prolyl cis-trans isomerase A (cyclophilin A)